MIHGKNPVLLNVNYIRPKSSRNDDGEIIKIPESFEVIYKTEDGQIYKSNEPAETDIYFVKPEFRNFNYNKPQEHMDHLYTVRSPISKIRYKIAEEIGPDGLEFIKQCSENTRKDVNSWKQLNRLYGWRYSFGADFQPEFYFMRDWYKKYPLSENIKLTKAFMDIETEIIDYQPDMDHIPGTAYAPVNLITLFLEETKECFTFILRPHDPSKLSYSKVLNPDVFERRYDFYEKQMRTHNEFILNEANKKAFIKDLNKSFDPMYGYIDYNLREYKDEIDLIADVFRLIHDRKPNFCMQWNMRFDIQYLLERIKVLGYNPESIMCHPDFDNPGKCYFHVDRSTFQMEKQFDYFYCRSYTQFICQMRLYASIRKSQQMLKSVKLNDIGDRELRDKKVDYPANANIMTFPFEDWLLFIKYNIKDVLITVGIERKTNDVMTYYMKSHSNLTPYNKIFRETHLLRNVREMYFNRDGLVQQNNINIIDKDEDEDTLFYSIDDDDDDGPEFKGNDRDGVTFKGAINAEPTMNDNVGIPILGVPSNKVHRNAMDYDMGAFYPSIKDISNMDPSTLIGKASFNNEEFISGEYNNRSLNTTYFERDKNGVMRKLDITGEAVNEFVSGNILTFGYSWLGYPSITEIMKECMKEANK